MLQRGADDRSGPGYDFEENNRYSMPERNQALDADANDGTDGLDGLQSLPLGSVWSVLTSEVGDAFATTTATTQDLDSTTQLRTTEATHVSTALKTDTTASSTSSLTTATSTSGAELLKPPTLASTTSTRDTTTSVLVDSTQSDSSRIITSFSQVTTGPVITRTSTLNSRTLPISVETYAPLTSSPSPGSNNPNGGGNGHKHAIIGGLSALIAALLLICIFLFLFLRRRRKLREKPSPFLEEKGFFENLRHECFTPPPARWSDKYVKPESGSPAAPVRAHAKTASASVDEDHHIIRMSTQHWHRPFAQGRGEGIRDSAAPGLLRIMNPDPSRPNTPDNKLLPGKKKMPTFATMLLYHQPRSRTPSSLYEHRRSPPPIPNITIDPAVSRTCSTRSAYSIPSLIALPVVQQRPPEDPFLTPPDDEVPPNWPLPGPISEPKRTLLRPFRVNQPDSRRSSSSRASSLLAPGSRYSDPFDLDRRSARSSLVHGGGGTGVVGGQPGWQVYEGT